MSDKLPRVNVISTSCTSQRNLSCNTDNVGICGRDANGTVHTVRTDSEGRLEITGTDVDTRPLQCNIDSVSICGSEGVPVSTVQGGQPNIRNLTCDRDNVKICGSTGIPIKTDNQGSIIATINQEYTGSFETLSVPGNSIVFSTAQDVSQVFNYVFYIRYLSLVDGPDIFVFLDLSPDGANFFSAFEYTMFPGELPIFLPSINRGSIEPINRTQTGFPLPARSARIHIINLSEKTVTVNVGFSAWRF